jgi:hypothetical protein
MTKDIVLFSVAALCASLTGCQSCGRHEPKNALQIKLPAGTPQRPQGLKALAVSPGPTPFTQGDVTQYVRTHQLARSIGDLSQLKVDSLEFITAQEVTIRLQGASTGLPDSQRVAFAIIRGPLYFTGPAPGKPVAFESAYALFDAGTGNLLMSGTLDLAKASKDRGQQPPK